jgi:hypothetical protein
MCVVCSILTALPRRMTKYFLQCPIAVLVLKPMTTKFTDSFFSNPRIDENAGCRLCDSPPLFFFCFILQSKSRLEYDCKSRLHVGIRLFGILETIFYLHLKQFSLRHLGKPWGFRREKLSVSVPPWQDSPRTVQRPLHSPSWRALPKLPVL